MKTPGESFRLKMSTENNDSTVLKTPNKCMKTKHWSPRRFVYGGRSFIWKASKDGGGVFKSFEWETLHEMSKMWKVKGSKTGKMEDEVVGPRLAWGEKGGGNTKAEHTLYYAGGLDQHLREHLLASRLSKFTRTSQPLYKDARGLEAAGAVGAVSGLLGFVGAINELAG